MEIKTITHVNTQGIHTHSPAHTYTHTSHLNNNGAEKLKIDKMIK